MQFGNVAQGQAAGQLMAEEAAGVIEGGQRRVLLRLVAAQPHADVGMAAILADVDLGHIHRQQPRVVGFKADDLAEFLAERFGNAKCAAFIHGASRRSRFVGQVGNLRADC